jgi:hypothetical protein
MFKFSTNWATKKSQKRNPAKVVISVQSKVISAVKKRRRKTVAKEANQPHRVN